MEDDMKKIMLRDLKGACTDQRKLFAKIFPNGAPVTMAAAMKAIKAGLDILWLIRLLPALLYADYRAKLDPLYADYRAKLDPLDADYESKYALLYADYESKRAPLDADYRAKLDPLYADYESKRAPLDADYRAKRAQILIAALRAMP
jgi:hypothetical protein